MSESVIKTRSVVVERETPFPQERVWRALTQPHLIEEWLMKNDFEPAVGHKFKLTADWGSVDCQVLEIEPMTSLVYSWGAMGVGTNVSWTLTPTEAGTLLRMEQSGFGTDASHDRYYQGASFGWQRFFAALDRVLARLD